jgi:hypothetical protein
VKKLNYFPIKIDFNFSFARGLLTSNGQRKREIVLGTKGNIARNVKIDTLIRTSFVIKTIAKSSS